MAEILKGGYGAEAQRSTLRHKKAAYEARLATLENIKQEIASFSSQKYLSN
jgi:hypothetical protein